MKMFAQLCTDARAIFDLHVPFNCQRENKKIIYANVYRNTINDGDSQTPPLPIFPEGGGTSVHRLHLSLRRKKKEGSEFQVLGSSATLRKMDGPKTPSRWNFS